MLETNGVSEVDFRKALSRVGMRVCGEISPRSHGRTVAEEKSVGNVAWAGAGYGSFRCRLARSKIVELETLARKDVVVCSVVLNHDEAWTDFAIGDTHFDAKWHGYDDGLCAATRALPVCNECFARSQGGYSGRRRDVDDEKALAFLPRRCRSRCCA